MRHSSEHRETPAPWPVAIGLLAASMTTMLGCIVGHEQETILLRCTISGLVVWWLATSVRSVWRFVTAESNA